MKTLDKLPCASMLVRIKRAPMSRDGLKVLGINSGIPENKWTKLGILDEKPDYKMGTYNTSLITIRDSEKFLFYRYPN